MTPDGEPELRYSVYEVAEEPLPDGLTSMIVHDVLGHEAHRSRVLASLGVVGVVVVSGLALVFWQPAVGVVLLVGGVIAGAAGLYHRRVSRRVLQERDRRMQALTHAERHVLTLSGPHLLAVHEHGFLLATALDDRRTFLRDISSVADDPWDELFDEAVASRTIPRSWSWWRLPGYGWPVATTTTGPRIPLRVADLDGAPDTMGQFLGIVDDPWSENHVSGTPFTSITRLFDGET